VKAINIVGESEYSTAGNGAKIITLPDPPINLQDNAGVTNMIQIGLTWEDAAFDGGSEILDYRIWYTTQDSDVFSVLATGELLTSYTAVTLSTGTTYKFKVQSRNEYSYSDFSNEVSILAAQRPSKPDAPTTTWSNAND
jgi:hypothetical protein